VEPVTPDGAGPIGIGAPIDNTLLLVLDEHGKPVPAGVVGELHIGGRSLARGYLHDEEQTRRRFIHLGGASTREDGGRASTREDGGRASTREDGGRASTREDGGRSSTREDGRLYRTGDLVRWVSGSLEFRGRVDDQVKVRGFRVEPGEATQALRAVPGVSDGVVVALRDGDGQAYLAGYVVGGPDAPPDLAGHAQRELLRALPEYLTPRVWSVLDALPRDPNGKLDRRALPAPAPVNAGAALDGAAADGGGAAAQVPRLRAMWAKVLGLSSDQIAEDADFFDLGGHSISAMKLLSRVRQGFGLECPTLEFYQDPSFAAMAARLTNTADAADHGQAEDQILAEELASDQQFYMVSQASARPGGSWNITLHVDLTGELRVAALRAAMSAVVERHQSLRTRFAERDGRWWQQVLPARALDVPVVDLRAADDREAR
ncbi:MAG: phosphopantetheine-binding protein, partial [Micromonosporaceae bacterium]